MDPVFSGEMSSGACWTGKKLSNSERHLRRDADDVVLAVNQDDEK